MHPPLGGQSDFLHFQTDGQTTYLSKKRDCVSVCVCTRWGGPGCSLRDSGLGWQLGPSTSTDDGVLRMRLSSW